MRFRILILVLALFAASCRQDATSSSSTPAAPPAKVTIPSFDPASAYAFIERQVSFGTRQPGSPGHQACRDWMIQSFKDLGAEVVAQDFPATALDGQRYTATNIIARINPDHGRRVLLSAHWDTRAQGDYDPDPARHKDPIPGADDGGSGVAVLMEIARLLQASPIDMGVDIVLFDAEDQGKNNGEDPLSWCQGAQHWSRSPHVKNYKALYGIHLDMVGAKNARFGLEGVSRAYAPQIQDKLWNMARGMGYGMYFVTDLTNPVTDDHKFVNEILRIPAVDIINQPLGSNTGFGAHWHTHGDDLAVIDKQTLKAVGQVVTAAVYNTYMQKF